MVIKKRDMACMRWPCPLTTYRARQTVRVLNLGHIHVRREAPANGLPTSSSINAQPVVIGRLKLIGFKLCKRRGRLNDFMRTQPPVGRKLGWHVAKAKGANGSVHAAPAITASFFQAAHVDFLVAVILIAHLALFRFDNFGKRSVR